MCGDAADGVMTPLITCVITPLMMRGNATNDECDNAYAGVW